MALVLFMDFFVVKTTSDKKIVGPEYPQIKTMSGNVDAKAPNSLYKIYPDLFPDFTPNLNYFVLNKNAKLTDFISAAMISHGFILNDKVKKILEQFKLPPYRFYPATVEHNGTFHNNYYWFFYISDILSYIDYKKTKFFIVDMFDNKIEDCKNMHSPGLLESLKEVLPNDRNIDSDAVFLKTTIKEHLDLFKLPFGNYRTYISKRLCNNLKNINISGVIISDSQQVQIAP